MLKAVVIPLVLASTIVGTIILTICFGTDPVYTSSSFSNLSRDLTFATHNPSTVAIGLQLFTLSSYPIYIRIESTDWDYKSCEMSVDSSRGRIAGTIHSAALGEKILVWSFNEVDYQYSKRIELANLTFLLVDPWDCSYEALSNFVYSVSSLSIETLVNEKYFDVVLPRQNSKCSPCRFDENGKQIELQHQIPFGNVVSIDRIHVKTFNKGGNYVCAFNFEDDASAIKILDQDFNVLEHMNISFKVQELAVTSGSRESLIGILYQLHEHQFYISVFDSSLRSVFTVQLPHPHAYKIVRAYLSMDSQGNSFVTSALLGKSKKYHLLRYDATGHLDSELQLDQFQRTARLVTQTFLMDDREYCVVNHFKAYEVNETGRTYVKCVDVTKI